MRREKLTLRGDSSEIHSALNAIKEADKAAEKRGSTGCWMIALSVLGLFGSLVLSDSNPTLGMSGLGVAGAVLVVGIVQSVRGRIGNIEDERYELVMELHRCLSVDCDRDTQYEYQLDLRPYTHSSFYLRRQGMLSIFPGGKTSFYRTPLVSTRLRLRDGTSLSIQVDRATSERTRTGFSARGKIKTKTKRKYRDIYQIKVKLPSGSAPPEKLMPISRPASSSALEYDGFVARQPVSSFMAEPKYKAQGTRASVVYVKKTSAAGGPDPTILLRLLCLTFFSIHQERQKSA